tara:strand:+ start:4658 stop:5242 length:585 start_codon:yes stop_codon:yes gene_type:complete
MWWNIIKNKLTTTATSGSFDFEEEEIPEKDEPDCKEKLLAIQDALIDFRPTGTKYRGASHKRGSDIMQSFIYQEKPYDETKKEPSHQWLHRGTNAGMRIVSNRQAFRKITNEEACKILEELKEMSFNNGMGYQGKHVVALAVYDVKVKAISIIGIRLKDDTAGHFYRIFIGHQDRDFAKKAFDEVLSFIKQQVK